MTVLAVIPARGGSTRIPRKNMQVVGGMTLVERAWRCAAEVFTDAVVSTDDAEIAEHVRGFGGQVLMRHESAAGDKPMAAVVLDALAQASTMPGYAVPSTVAVLQPTTPQRTPEILERILWHSGDDGYWRPVVSVHRDGHSWVRNGAIYVTWRDGYSSPLPKGELWNTCCYVCETPPLIDINTPEDLARVRELMG